VQPERSFVVDRCSKRLKAVILYEFQGRCPTLDEVLSISHKKWLAVPGMGPTLLKELDSLTKGQQSEPNDALTGCSDAELLELLQSLQRQVSRLHRDVQRLLMNRPTTGPIPNFSDLH